MEPIKINPISKHDILDELYLADTNSTIGAFVSPMFAHYIMNHGVAHRISGVGKTMNLQMVGLLGVSAFSNSTIDDVFIYHNNDLSILRRS